LAVPFPRPGSTPKQRIEAKAASHFSGFLAHPPQGAPGHIFRGMAEIRTVTTLRSKRAEILASIAQYEKRIAQARADLS
jgi:hypothetical protein